MNLSRQHQKWENIIAIYVEATKTVNEDDNFAYYIYQFEIPDQEYTFASGKQRYTLKTVSRKLKINKKSGDVDIVELADGDSGMHAKCAALALI